MTAPLIAVCLGLASVAVATATGHAVMAAAERALRGAWWLRRGARTRAGWLLHARLAPATLSLLFVPLVQLAFWVFEPATGSESVGLVLPGLAVAGLAVVLLGVRRAVVTVAATRRLTTTWRRVAAPHAVDGWQGPAWLVATQYPLVAVVGVRRAELFVSHGVERACSAREIEAIAAHERAHVRGHDNLTRLALALTPALGRSAACLERAWESTAEELADLQSRAGGDGLTLARALMKVARLAAGLEVPQALPISALIGTGDLEARVRRLLAAPAAPGRPVGRVPAALAVVLVLGATAGLRTIYAAAELLVHLGR